MTNDQSGVVGSGQSGLERAVERIRKVYAGWTRTTTVEEMRRDWDNLFWTDAFPAQSTPVSANGVDAMWIDALGADRKKVLLYFHGGGFSVGSVRSHYDLIARLSAAAGCRALGINYRQVPEHRFPAQIEDAVAAYRWLLAQGYASNSIALVGDSAGGNLALATLLSLREQNVPLPAATAGMSVWTDLTASGKSYETRADVDPIDSRKMILGLAKGYLGDADPRNPLASPLFADLHGLPPLLLQVGDREIVLDDSRDFAEKARAAGVDVQIEVWDDMIHVFQQFTTELVQARQAIETIGQFLKKHWQVS